MDSRRQCKVENGFAQDEDAIHHKIQVLSPCAAQNHGLSVRCCTKSWFECGLLHKTMVSVCVAAQNQVFSGLHCTKSWLKYSRLHKITFFS